MPFGALGDGFSVERVLQKPSLIDDEDVENRASAAVVTGRTTKNKLAIVVGRALLSEFVGVLLRPLLVAVGICLDLQQSRPCWLRSGSANFQLLFASRVIVSAATEGGFVTCRYKEADGLVVSATERDFHRPSPESQLIV